MIKNIVFDWNGVISNGLNATYWTTNEALEILGAKKISLDEFRREWEQPYMLFWNKYLPDLTLEQENEAFAKVLPNAPEQEVYSGVKEVLENFIKQKIKMAVLSGDFKHFVQKGLKKIGLEEDIFCDYACNVHDKLKDLKEIIEKNNFDSQETLIIGDTTHETEIGKELGLTTVAITWGFQLREKLKSAEPDYIVDNLKQLEDIVLKLNNNK